MTFQKGHPNYNKHPARGWKHTKEWKQIMHQKMAGRERPAFSKDWKANIGKAQKDRFKQAGSENHTMNWMQLSDPLPCHQLIFWISVARRTISPMQTAAVNFPVTQTHGNNVFKRLTAD